MSDGILINQSGTIVAVVHGYGGTPAPTQTFMALSDLTGVKPGDPAPAAIEAVIAPTDKGMVRVIEDLIEVLISKGVLGVADLPAPAIAKINARRAMRGLAPLA